MFELLLAACIAPLLLVLGIMLAVFALSDKRGRKRLVKGAVSAMLLVCFSGAVWYLNTLPPGQFGAFFWGDTSSGTAPAEYYEPHVIGGDNGSAIIAWTTNAGRKYTQYPFTSWQSPALACAHLDGKGRLLRPGPAVDGRMPLTWDSHIRELRYQDGFLFIRGDTGTAFRCLGGEMLSGFPTTTWNEMTIYQLPGGPVLIPPRIGWPVADIHDNGARSPTGQLYFLNGSFPVTCTVLDGTGNVSIDSTPLEYWGKNEGYDIGGLAFDGNDRLLMLVTRGGPASRLSMYNPNLTLAGEFRFDDSLLAGKHWMTPLTFAYLGGNSCGLIMLDGGTPNGGRQFNANLTLVLMTLNGSGVSDLRMSHIATINRITGLDCAFSLDGRGVLVVYEYEQELHLRSLDLLGNLNFKDVRLTPTDDKYSWDVPRD